MLPPVGTILGCSRVSTGHQSLDQQADALTAAGVDQSRIYTDRLSGATTQEQRPGLAALLDYAREGDVIVVVGIDRLGRSTSEVMGTIADLLRRGIIIRAIREGVDSSTPTGRAVLGIMSARTRYRCEPASLAELELELGRERRTAAREARRARGQSIGRPKVLDSTKAALAQRMHASGESATTTQAR
jgi:DNA invertase Pin-like site-specific DNA recombinase